MKEPEQDVTPLVGPVYGFRTWSVGRTGSKWVDGTTALRSRGTTWTSPDQTARCVEDDGNIFGVAWARAMFGTKTPQVRGDHTPVSDPHCWCGLYAHSTLARCLEKAESSLRRGEDAYDSTVVLGLVRASGRVIAAERGFRAERMSIDTLVCIHSTERLFRRHQNDVRDIGRSLDVPVVCAKLNKPSLNRAFAHREGVYLWMEEAPWTSDVTSEPTKSSTQRSQRALWQTTVIDDTTQVWSDPPNSVYLSASDDDEAEGVA